MKRKKRNIKNLLITIEILCIIIFMCASFNVFFELKDYRQAELEYTQLTKKAGTDIRDDYGDDSVKELRTSNLKKDGVDFELFQKENSDFAGWIIWPGTGINYPIVKSKDNEEYLYTTFEGKKSNSGAIFMDKNCAMDFNDRNTIIYGHNMKNGTMFHLLNNLADFDFFEEHQEFWIDSGNGFEAYRIISCYETREKDLSSWQLTFSSNLDYGLWLENIQGRCNYKCVDYDCNKNTITLSTCRGNAGGDKRYVVHLQKAE